MFTPDVLVSLVVLAFAGGILSFSYQKYRAKTLDKTMFRIVLVLGVITIAFALTKLAAAPMG